MTLREFEPAVEAAGGHTDAGHHARNAPDFSGGHAPVDHHTRSAAPGIAPTTSEPHPTSGDPDPSEPAEHVAAPKLPVRARGAARSGDGSNLSDRTLAEREPIQAASGPDGGQSMYDARSTSAAVTLSEPAVYDVAPVRASRARGAARSTADAPMMSGGSDPSDPQDRGGGHVSSDIPQGPAPADHTASADAALKTSAGSRKRGGGHSANATQTGPAPAKKTRRAVHAAKPESILPYGGDGPSTTEAHRADAAAKPSRKPKALVQPDTGAATEGEVPLIAETPSGSDLATIVDLWRQRGDLKRAASRLNLQALAVCRRASDGDKEAAQKAWALVQKGTGPDDLTMVCEPYRVAMAGLEKSAHSLELQLGKLVRKHPLAPWAKDVRGLGELSLAGIIGEASGNPGDYKSVSALWKRFGLAVIGGERQRRVAGAEQALLHGYAPQRRAFAYVVSCNLMKSQKAEDAYRQLYDRRKAYELAREVPDKDGELQPVTKAHAHNRAMRVMVKELLKHVWAADRRARRIETAEPRAA